MSKLTVQLIQDKLMEEDEVKKATAQKMKLSQNRKPREVGKPGDPSTKLTKISQVEVPGASKAAKKASKTTKSSDKTGIPQAKLAGEYVDKMDKPKMSSAKNEKSPKVPSVKQGPKPNQTTKTKETKGAIKNTEAGSTKSEFPSADYADTYTKKMPHGNKNLKASGDQVPTITKPKVDSMGATTRPKGGERKASGLGDAKKDKPKQIDKPGGSLPTPKDAPKPVKWDTNKQGHNVIESVEIRLGGKPKARFDVVNRNVVKRMVESYAKHGYELEVVRSSKPAAWKSDKKLLGLIREAVDAKHNFVPKMAEAARKRAMNRFFQINRSNYNSLYESNGEFAKTLHEAFGVVMEKAEQKYMDRLEVFECMARVSIDGDVADLEIVTEATGHEMALRQVRNEIAEEYGLETEIKHIFVDGKKYRPNQITSWSSKMV